MIDDILEFEAEIDDKLYKIERIETIDVSDQDDLPAESVLITHRIVGFEVPLFLVIYPNEEQFDIGYYLEVARMLIGLQDEEMYGTAVELIQMAIDTLNEFDSQF